MVQHELPALATEGLMDDSAFCKVGSVSHLPAGATKLLACLTQQDARALV